MSWVAVAVGVGTSAAKYGVDQAQASRQRKLQAIKEQYSPWTGQHGQDVQDPNAAAGIAQGAAAGAGMGQSIAQQAANNALQKGQLDLMRARQDQIKPQTQVPPTQAGNTTSPGVVPAQSQPSLMQPVAAPRNTWSPYGANMNRDYL